MMRWLSLLLVGAPPPCTAPRLFLEAAGSIFLVPSLHLPFCSLASLNSPPLTAHHLLPGITFFLHLCTASHSPDQLPCGVHCTSAANWFRLFFFICPDFILLFSLCFPPFFLPVLVTARLINLSYPLPQSIYHFLSWVFLFFYFRGRVLHFLLRPFFPSRSIAFPYAARFLSFFRHFDGFSLTHTPFFSPTRSYPFDLSVS